MTLNITLYLINFRTFVTRFTNNINMVGQAHFYGWNVNNTDIATIFVYNNVSCVVARAACTLLHTRILLFVPRHIDEH